ncbi:MAG: ABC transporter [Bdellovibrio sp. CG12_big_fil_rev_8_21_14_0_65_39_13]|nr:MAG: ABC transporter [Bdellovibrio sp. CG22_combo_CG10-13_8_21_14_all_39_27]PIQ61312.1 MAG: ABC transporter [Bdellovibrio sp. CG12_big_fil_rev_8_21_14_0_65_39_13]PIR33622.1 MAG: ABC transporter [Bdellovibrio sp. CG11_big_fil_rev_8_21_14_0_20_39_38]PJB53753.1 MAG: ABC transporter [Bdellovibrio sp. CG_4_9_14_3_um_filter_39_7]
MSEILKIEKLSFKRNVSESILKEIDLILNSSETLGIIGPNGGGKSTLLKLIVGLLKPTSGHINYKGRLMGYLPQTAYTENVFPITINDVLDFSTLKHQGLLKKEEVLELVGLTKPVSTLMTKLSGGERQRVHLARALMSGPDLLILDEPTQGLDSTGQDQLLSLINKIKIEYQTAIIIVDHNINQLIKHCDKILCLNRTQHWHNHKDLLNKSVLESIYHCEFEHILLHEKEDLGEHHACDHDLHNHDHHNHKESK